MRFAYWRPTECDLHEFFLLFVSRRLRNRYLATSRAEIGSRAMPCHQASGVQVVANHIAYRSAARSRRAVCVLIALTRQSHSADSGVASFAHPRREALSVCLSGHSARRRSARTGERTAAQLLGEIISPQFNRNHFGRRLPSFGAMRCAYWRPTECALRGFSFGGLWLRLIRPTALS
jgi:hypothetical protein